MGKVNGYVRNRDGCVLVREVDGLGGIFKDRVSDMKFHSELIKYECRYKSRNEFYY
jgi:hypothetical protein